MVSYFPAILRQAAAPGSHTFRMMPFSLIYTSRSFASSTAPRSERLDLAKEQEPFSAPLEELDDLRNRIFRLRFPKRSATAVLEKWVSEGREATAPELRNIAWDLRRSQRFKHALEIIMWMESQSSFMASESDQAQKLDLIIKVNGIDKAELYLEQITNRALKKAACLFLLRLYVKKKELEKAEALMAKLGSLGFIVTPHPFNEIMKLYAAKGLFSKVIYVIRHMKLSKVPLNVLSYNLWMDASSKASDIASVEKIFKEMTGDKNVEVRWNTYCTLANIYTRYGLVDRALAALKIAENKLYVKQRPGYSFVMTIYAALGDRKGVLRLWEANKSAVGRIPCAPYMCVISCLVEVGDILEAERVFEMWESQCFKYHIRVPNILIGSYMSNGCIEKAERLFLRALKKGAVPNNKTWEILIEGWVRNKQLDKAAEALKKHFSLGKHCIWRPPPEVLLAIVEYYEKLCYIDEATGFVELLQRMGLMNLHLYKLFVRLHIQARKAIPGILKMMDLDSIVPDEETNSLIQQADDILVLKASID